MKILYAVTDQDLASFHGGTIHVKAVASELMRHSHQIHLIIQQASQPRNMPPSIVVHEIPRTNRFLLWKAGSRIQAILQDIQPDIVMERYYNFAGEAVLRASAQGIPSVLEVNSPMIEYAGSPKSKLDLLFGGVFRKRRERIAEAASLIISPMLEIVPKKYQAKVREIEWGADANLFNPDSLPDRDTLRTQMGFNPEEVLLIHFGSLRKWHGLVKLLEAYDFAKPQFKKPVRLIIIGPAESGSSAQRPGVQFVGSVAHDQLPLWLKLSDLAVLPFALEQHKYLELGFYWSPLKLFEAMAMQMPILTLDHQRLKALLGTDDPDFFYDGSMQSLSQKIVSAVNNLTSLKLKAQQFRKRIIDFYSWEMHGNNLNRWLLETVGIHK